MGLIFKVCGEKEWQEAKAGESFSGAAIDLKDGYIHFSTASQLPETLARHFAGRTDLVLIAVDEMAVSGHLKYEPSRGGDLFPHLYAELPMSAVSWEAPISYDGHGHVIPPGTLA
jgi:uncharacterized protein (DUF952 family)